MRSKGKYEEYRKLNAAFQKKARQDKEQRIREKCRQIEELNKIGKRLIQRNKRDEAHEAQEVCYEIK